MSRRTIAGLLTLSLLPFVQIRAEQRQEFLMLLDQSEADRARILRSAAGAGTIMILSSDKNEGQTNTLLDCEFRVWFDNERIRLERDYRIHKLQKAHQRGSWLLDADGFVQQTLISNGNTNYLCRFDTERNPTCYLLTRPWCDKLLSNLDSPGSHPVRIWEDASHILRDDDLEFAITKLRNGGMLGRGKGGNWSVECMLSPPTPLCLTRVAVRAGGSLVQEHNLQWSGADGLMLAHKYTRRMVQHADTGKTSRVLMVEIQFSRLEANVAVDPRVFDVASLGVPPGTEFRQNAPIPRKFTFDGQKLVSQ